MRRCKFSDLLIIDKTRGVCVLISSRVASKNGYRTACHRLVRFSVLCDLSFRSRVLGGQYFILESISFPVDKVISKTYLPYCLRHVGKKDPCEEIKAVCFCVIVPCNNVELRLSTSINAWHRHVRLLQAKTIFSPNTELWQV